MPIFTLFLLIPITVIASPEVEDAKKSIYSLIRPLLMHKSETPKGEEKFQTNECSSGQKIDWSSMITSRKEVMLEYKFREGCDVQGKISPKIIQPFPANLDLRNLDSYSRIESQCAVTAMFQKDFFLNLTITEGVLKGKNTVKFEADYRVQINPARKNLIEKNLGGELRITEINGKIANIREKIYVP